MDGPAVFRATARRFPAFMADLFEKAGARAEHLGVIIPHQASQQALEHLKRSLPDGHARTIDIFRTTGNQIATSLPHALHVARAGGHLRAGELGLLIGSSAGISLGGAVIRW
jgi:3-oxoacyl-[acyl-carrier-protein] synthase-3